MFDELEKINLRPESFQYYTADALWTDEHTSKQILQYHLNESIDVSSRNKKFIDRSVEWMTSRFDISSGISVIDFGCGPGLYTARLAENGADVTGIDFSERSIQYAKNTATQKELKINYICQNYLEFQTEKRFDLITMIMCDFCALSPAQRKEMLCKFHGLLKSRGSVLLDVYSLNAFEQREETATYELNQLDGFWSQEKYYGFLNTFKYNDQKVALDKYTIVEKEQMRTIYNWLQYFSVDSIKAEFKDNGFAIEHIYSDVAGTDYSPGSPEIAIVASKD